MSGWRWLAKSAGLVMMVMLSGGCTADRAQLTVNPDLSGRATVEFVMADGESLDDCEAAVADRLNQIGINRYGFSTDVSRDRKIRRLRLDLRWRERAELERLINTAYSQKGACQISLTDRQEFKVLCPPSPVDLLTVKLDGDLVGGGGERSRDGYAVLNYRSGQSPDFVFRPAVVPHRLKLTLAIGGLAFVIALIAVWWLRRRPAQPGQKQ
ncbi:MAG: hypothetical protein N3A57_07645 [Negativicutes bacterium]|nr:hypothetical protein [Negativicutes bacterium]